MPPKKVPVSKGTQKTQAKPAVTKTTPAKSPASGSKKVTQPVPKKGTSTASKGKPTEVKPVKKVWTEKDDAALRIQTKFRQYFAKLQLINKKKKRQEYEDLMEKLEREAYVKIVKMQQEEFERELQKEEEERKRKRAENLRKKKMLEAAFDGDDDELLALLKEVKQLDDNNGIGDDVIGRALRNKHQLNMVECEDANNNTPLSEASSGGHCSTVTLLIERGADPNTRGQFNRSPLYRAAFAGHLDVCQLLLQYGADPRIYADDGQTPEQVASHDPIKQLLQNWDISQTEVLLEKLDMAKKKRLEENRKRQEAEEMQLEDTIKELQKQYDIKQKQLSKAYNELNKRIEEHDRANIAGFERTDITLQVIHDAEAELEIAKMNEEKAREKLTAAKFKLREQKLQGQMDNMAGDDHLPGVKVMVKELDEVLVRDIGNKIEDSGKWPLLIDPSGQAATFLRYRDTNYIQALSPKEMEPERIRKAVLGAIRFGKPVVLDMMEVEMFDTCRDRFDEIQKGLMDSIMDKSILQNEKFLSLVKKEDGEQYRQFRFNDMFLKNFRFIIITKNPLPSDELLEKTYPLRIYIPT